MMDFLGHMTEWHWLIFGMALVVAEIAVPGTFLLWPGLAAVIVGLVKAVAPSLAWTVCVALWAVLSVATVGGFLFWRNRHPAAGPNPTLNRRGQQYVGQRFTIESSIVNGKGAMRVGDGTWPVVAETDLPAGTTVRVTAVEGTALRVEKF